MPAELKKIPLNKLVPHPDNPRVVMREDVIAAIVANLDGEFPKKHAVHTRKLDGTYQILSGHQRQEAAKRKGLEEIWAWVDDLDDESAFMELVTSNNQGELSPLEIGIHALKAVPKSEGGRGKKGGLSEYAGRIGKTQGYVSQVRQAAEVAAEIPNSQLIGFLTRSQHLCAIHKLPKECWQAACEFLASKDMPVADTEERVSQALNFMGEFDCPEWKDFLPKRQCTGAVFCGTDPNNFRKLADLATRVLAGLPDDLGLQWKEWLLANVGGDSWDIRKAQDKRVELENIAWEREHAPEPSTVVSLILADPPWQYDFAETDNRQVENQYPTATVEEICSHIKAPWAPEIGDDAVLFLWATAPKLQEALQVMESWEFEYKTHAIWDKEKIGMGYWFRGQHELLLVGTRGEMSPPDASARVSSVFREERGRHSAKPACVYAAIEAMFPSAVKCEFYQRKERKGWIGVGNES